MLDNMFNLFLTNTLNRVKIQLMNRLIVNPLVVFLLINKGLSNDRPFSFNKIYELWYNQSERTSVLWI